MSNLKNRKKSEILEKCYPLSMWNFVGYSLLFSIPLVGWIILFVISFDDEENINLRNYARSYLIIFILNLVLIILYNMLVKN